MLSTPYLSGNDTYPLHARVSAPDDRIVIRLDFPDPQSNQTLSWCSPVGEDKHDELLDPSKKTIAHISITFSPGKPLAGDMIFDDPDAADAPAILVMYAEVLRLRRLYAPVYFYEERAREPAGYSVKDWYGHLIYEVRLDESKKLTVLDATKQVHSSSIISCFC